MRTDELPARALRRKWQQHLADKSYQELDVLFKHMREQMEDQLLSTRNAPCFNVECGGEQLSISSWTDWFWMVWEIDNIQEGAQS